MSFYASMLLERGGGISVPAPEKDSAEENQQENTTEDRKSGAGLIIGLGGTGIAALDEVKAHLGHSREGVQFLSVDAQTGEDVFALLSPGSAKPSTRQRGRAMILSREEPLRQKIEELCLAALAQTGEDAASLSVFILAGLSGITGGSCCADLCRIVRGVLSQTEEKIRTSVHGLFFLPDVAQSSPAVFGHSDVVERRFEQACGYAALKELDSLMKLSERPVDFFCLISATNEYGSISSNAYETCLAAAAGYVAGYLRMPEGKQRILDRRRGQRAEKDDKSRYVTALGAAQRSVPLRETVTFAASRFGEDFRRRLKEEREQAPGYVQSHDAARRMGIDTENILEKIREGCPAFVFPETDMRELRSCGPVSDGEYPSVWSEQIETWLENCEHIRMDNRRSLRREFQKSLNDKIHSDMFAKGRGPYYVRDFLDRRGSDIREVLHDVGEDIRDRLNARRESLYGRHGRGGLVTDLERASSDFVRAGIFGKSRKYDRYREAAEKLLQAQSDMLVLLEAGKLIKETESFIERYEKRQLEPLLRAIGDLADTSAENIRFLEKEKGTKSGFIKPFIRREDLQSAMEEVMRDTDRDEFSREFLSFLLKAAPSGAWEKRIGIWLGATFGSICLEAADEYMIRMQEQTQRAMERLLARTTVQLWCDAAQTQDAPEFFLLDAPLLPSSLHGLAAASAAKRGSSCIFYSSAEDEIAIVRIRDGISVSGYRGLLQMQKEYSPYIRSSEMNLEL